MKRLLNILLISASLLTVIYSCSKIEESKRDNSIVKITALSHSWVDTSDTEDIEDPRIYGSLDKTEVLPTTYIAFYVLPKRTNIISSHYTNPRKITPRPHKYIQYGVMRV